MAVTYSYPRPALTVDSVVFKQKTNQAEVLLIQRDKPPFEGMWALPGGFVEMDETLEEAALRELEEETGITEVSLIQLHTFGAPDRDPRHRTVSVVFWGWLESNQKAVAGDDARSLRWFDINKLPELAFDHKMILQMAIARAMNGE
jgi:8-oxo-dGTP diphosphatase